MISEPETFYAKIRDWNNCLIVAIPKNLVTFAGFEKGEIVKCLIKKKEEEPDCVNTEE